jgi:hypothetical protein
VSLEIGRKRVFASALDWPGWCRSGKSVEVALETLAGYASRYAPVVARAGLAFPAGLPDRLEVVEQVAGDATTDFGAPGAITLSEQALVDAPRQLGWLRSSTAGPSSTRWPPAHRGAPKGSTRRRPGPTKMIGHVVGAEAGYARYLGLSPGTSPATPPRWPSCATRWPGARPAWTQPYSERRSWPPRYAARRIAWHALDHAWEMQDRSVP